MALSVQVKGLDKLRANLRVLKDTVPEDLGYVLREEALAIMDESIIECPVDDSNLHEDGSPHLVDTAQVDGPTFEGNNVTVALSYGNTNDATGDYAVVQHETLEYHHTRPGTKAKYLEDPVNRRVPYLATNLIRGVTLEARGEGHIAKPTSDFGGKR